MPGQWSFPDFPRKSRIVAKVPDLGRLVGPGRQQPCLPLAIGELHAVDRFSASGECLSDLLAVIGPELDAPIGCRFTGCGDQLAVGGNSHRIDRLAVIQNHDVPARLGPFPVSPFPVNPLYRIRRSDHSRPVFATGDEPTAVRSEGQGFDSQVARHGVSRGGILVTLPQDSRLVGEILEPVEFPATQQSLVVGSRFPSLFVLEDTVQHPPDICERSRPHLGIGQADLGDIGFVFLRRLGREGLFLRIDGQVFGFPFLFTRHHGNVFGLHRVEFRELFLLASHHGDILGLDRVQLCKFFLAGRFFGLGSCDFFFLECIDGDLSLGSFPVPRFFSFDRLVLCNVPLLVGVHFRPIDEARQDRSADDDDGRHAAGDLAHGSQSLLARVALGLSFLKLDDDVAMRRIARIGGRQAQVEIAFLERNNRERQLGRAGSFAGQLVSMPELVGFVERENRARVILVVAGLFRFDERRTGPLRERQAVGMRLVFADRRLKRLRAGVTVGRVGGHRLKRNIEQFSLIIGGTNLIPSQNIEHLSPTARIGVGRIA